MPPHIRSISGRIEDFIKEPVVKALTDPDNRLIMIMGGSDTGKTTLVECIAAFLSKQTRVGIVDLDMGQSHIGPPTTIAWGKIDREFREWSTIAPEDFYFTGTVTPFGSLLPSVVGAKLMTERALNSCKKVIVDTTGLIAEPAGRVLKQSKIDILSPDMILALENSEELGHILDAFRFNQHPKFYRLPVPSHVKEKSVTKRSQYRFEKIKDYFVGSCTLEVLMEDVGIRFTKEPPSFSPLTLKKRLVSFRDNGNRDIALGFIEGIKLRENKLLIRTPISGDVKFSSIAIGRAEIDMTNSLLRDTS